MKRWIASCSALALAAALLAGCSSGIEKPRPAALQQLSAPVTLQPAWSQRVGEARFPLRLAVAGGVVVTASDDGSVAAFDLTSGAPRWRGQVDAKLSAGVGSDGRYAAVVTDRNEVVAFDQGRVLWRLPVPAKVVTAPLVAGERVFVQGVDRAVHAFDVLDGRRLWVFQRAGDALTLAQPGVLQPVANTLWAGVGPRLVALEPVRGQLKQDVIVATPRGGNEVERLADLVAPPARVGDMVCVRSFQTAVSCIDTARGALVWTKTQSGFQGVAADDALVVGGDASDRLIAWRRNNGEVFWRADQFVYRQLTAPAILGKHVVVADREGHVHLLSRLDGRTVGRLSLDGGGIVTPPVAAGGRLVVATRNGTLQVYSAAD